MITNEKQIMLKKIQAADFALDDIGLLLDTHPTDKSALETFSKYQKIYQILVKEYEEKYGALMSDRVDTSKGWTWIENPWPWEMEANS